MDFAGQIRAARAFLNLTQDQLAESAELSLQGMQKVERGETNPTERTQRKIVAALAKHGISFTETGIEYSEYPVYFLAGKTHEETYLKLLEDAFDHLRERKNPELLIMYADDKVSPPAVNNYYRKIRASGIRMRQLVQDGNTYLMGPLSEYRYVPKAFFINRVTLVYGDRIANLTGDFSKAIVRVDAVNTAVQRNTFDLLWSVLAAPTKTTAHDRF